MDRSVIRKLILAYETALLPRLALRQVQTDSGCPSGRSQALTDQDARPLPIVATDALVLREPVRQLEMIRITVPLLI